MDATDDACAWTRAVSFALAIALFSLPSCATSGYGDDEISFPTTPEYVPPDVPRPVLPDPEPVHDTSPEPYSSKPASGKELLGDTVGLVLLGAAVVGLELLTDSDDDDCRLSKRNRKILEKKGYLKKDDPCPVEFRDFD